MVTEKFITKKKLLKLTLTTSTSLIFEFFFFFVFGKDDKDVLVSQNKLTVYI